MRKNNFLKSDGIINGWIHSECTTSAEIIASSKFDSITIDLQHGMIGFEKCKMLLQILSKNKVYPIVRVPSNDIGIINKCLDAGAKAIICPLVNNKRECQSFTKNCYYPPYGFRSYGPTLAGISDTKYFYSANNEISSIVMIETVESVKNLNEILAVEHLDMVYVGPYDLSISHGYSPDKVFTEQSMLDVYEFILNKTLKYKKKAAIHCEGAETAKFFLQKGFSMVTISTDLNLIKKALNHEFFLLDN